jgi:hypothetical protein
MRERKGEKDRDREREREKRERENEKEGYWSEEQRPPDPVLLPVFSK